MKLADPTWLPAGPDGWGRHDKDIPPLTVDVAALHRAWVALAPPLSKENQSAIARFTRDPHAFPSDELATLLVEASPPPLVLLAELFGVDSVVEALFVSCPVDEDSTARLSRAWADGWVEKCFGLRHLIATEGALPPNSDHDHFATAALFAFLYDDEQLADRCIDEFPYDEVINATGYMRAEYIGSPHLAGALLATSRDTAKLRRIAPRVRPIAWFVRALIRRGGRDLFSVIERLRRYDSFSHDKSHTVIHLLRAIGSADARRAAVRYADQTTEFSLAQWMAEEPTVWENEFDAADTTKLRAYRARFEASFESHRYPKTEEAIETEVADTSDSTDVARSIRDTFCRDETKGWIEEDLYALTASLNDADLATVSELPWDRVTPTAALDPQRFVHTTYHTVLHRRVTQHTLRFPFACGEPAEEFSGPRYVWFPKKQLPKPQPEFALASIAPFLDHPNFVVRELAADITRRSFLNASPQVLERLQPDFERFDRLTRFAFEEEQFHRLRLAVDAPYWLRAEALDRPKNLDGSPFSVRECDTLLLGLLFLEKRILEWSDDVVMTIEMIDTLLLNRLGDRAPEPFAHRVDTDSLIPFAMSVFSLYEAFSRHGLGESILLMFGGELGVKKLHDIALGVEPERAIALLLSSHDREQITWVIAYKKRMQISENRVDLMIDRAAPLHGLSSFALWLLHAPTFDLQRAVQRVTYAHRTLTVDYADPLYPIVRNEKGEELKRAPKPKPGDTIGELAYAEFIETRDAIKRYATAILKRLTFASGKRDRIPASLFVEHVVRHPWVGRLAERIVWGLYDDIALVCAFRVDDEGRLVDLDEEPVHAQAHHMVGILAPNEVSKSAQRDWVRLLSSYEIIQPFDQFSRRID